MRKMLAAMLLFPGAIAAPADAAATIPGVVRQVPGVYRLTIGTMLVTALSDGTMPLDLHRMLRGISSAEIDALLDRNFLSNPLQPSINCYLIETGRRTVLVDTGAGDLFGPGNGGRLAEALSLAGVARTKIDDVLITHAHPDHIGGLVRAGEIQFPNAVIHIGKADLDFFLDPRQSSNRRASEQVAAMFKPYFDAGRVRPFDHDGELVPGISAELRPGHSPGSAIFRLTSAGEQLVIIGDNIHVAAVQLARPDATFLFDQDPAMARADRENALRAFAATGALVAAPHVSFPGIGHIRIDGDAYRWIPVEYGNRDPHAPDLKF